jgi:hypothetical protein
VDTQTGTGHVALGKKADGTETVGGHRELNEANELEDEFVVNGKPGGGPASIRGKYNETTGAVTGAVGQTETGVALQFERSEERTAVGIGIQNGPPRTSMVEGSIEGDKSKLRIGGNGGKSAVKFEQNAADNSLSFDICHREASEGPPKIAEGSAFGIKRTADPNGKWLMNIGDTDIDVEAAIHKGKFILDAGTTLHLWDGDKIENAVVSWVNNTELTIENWADDKMARARQVWDMAESRFMLKPKKKGEEGVEEEDASLIARVMVLEEERDELEDRIVKLEEENFTLTARIARLESGNGGTDLAERLAALEKDTLDQRIDALEAENRNIMQGLLAMYMMYGQTFPTLDGTTLPISGDVIITGSLTVMDTITGTLAPSE